MPLPSSSPSSLLSPSIHASNSSFVSVQSISIFNSPVPSISFNAASVIGVEVPVPIPFAPSPARAPGVDVVGGLWVSKSQSSASGSGSEEIACPSTSASSASSLDLISSPPSPPPFAVVPGPFVGAEGGVVDRREGSSSR